MKETADLIIQNAVIYTVDQGFSIKQAMAVRDGRILEVGPNKDLLEKYDAARVIDAEGRAIYPGFIDGHCHFVGYAMGLTQSVDLTGTRSFDEIIQLLRNYHERYPYVWILGRGWDQNDWDVKEFPDNSLLDRLFPDNPVVLTRVDGHAVLANSEALRRAGLTADRKIKGGEIIVRDNKMTGILIDNAADLMRAVIPEAGDRQLKEALLKAQENCFGVGLTSVVDAGLAFRSIQAIDSLHQSGELRIRINAMISPTADNLAYYFGKGPQRNEKLTVNSVKLYADGALGSRGALLLEPYSDDPGNNGLLMSSVDFYRGMLQQAYENGFQVNTHCIGDSANRLMLNLYGEVLQGPNDRRWRIEHVQIVNPDDFNLFSKYNVIPSIQATHCTSDMYWAEGRLGPERIRVAYAYKLLLQQNGWLVNGTDFPVEQIDPLLTFYASVSRQDLAGNPEGGFQPENSLTREEALRSMTIWAAKGSFEEDLKGSLEPGKLADFVILDQDIMSIEINEVPRVKVWKTYLSGEQVFPFIGEN